MTKNEGYAELKQHVISRLNGAIETCYNAKFKSCIKGLELSLNYVQNDMIPQNYNHFGAMYHRIPYDIYKMPKVKRLNKHKEELATALIISIFDSGELIERYVSEQVIKPIPPNIKILKDDRLLKRLDSFEKRFDFEQSKIDSSLLSNKYVKAMAAAWLFLNTFENYHKPNREQFKELFSNIDYEGYDRISKTSILLKYNSVYSRKNRKQKTITEKQLDDGVSLISDFDFIRNAIAHSDVCFNHNNISFYSTEDPSQCINIPISYFLEYPAILYIKTWTVAFLYECMHISIMIQALQHMK